MPFVKDVHQVYDGEALKETKMRIIVDVDCTTGDFVGAVCKISGETDRNRCNRWDWFSQDYDKETVSAIKEAMRRPEWWNKFPVIKDANKGIAWLRGQGHDLVWVTVPFIYCEGWLDARRKWLMRNFNIVKHNEPLITVSNANKYLIDADAIIDDVPEIVDAYSSKHPKAKCITFRSEFNQHLDRELVTWEDIMGMRYFWYGKHFGKGP